MATTGIEKIRTLTAADMQQVDALILSQLGGKAPLIATLAGHLIKAGGKRLRPVLTLISARLCGYEQGARHIAMAASVEFIHTATLLHDDVVDESALRRGEPTANANWGNSASVLVGDFLLARAFQLMVSDGSLDALKILSDTSAILSEGEVLQLSSAREITDDTTRYYDIITAKTASLFAAAGEIGAVISESPAAHRKALHDYGHHLGIAFQIVDDALDYSADQSQLGKAVGDDFREGKITLPVILSYKNGTPDEKKFWKESMEETPEGDAALKHAIGLVAKYNAVELSLKEANVHADKAIACLSIFPDSEWKEALTGLAHFAVKRSY